MEGRTESEDRRLKRCYQCNRLEDQLWAMAYEHVCPVVRRAWGQQQGELNLFGRETSSVSGLARRA